MVRVGLARSMELGAGRHRATWQNESIKKEEGKGRPSIKIRSRIRIRNRKRRR
jgi:hypothetical protein